MNIQSIALAFRLGLDFHALNNEGSGGTNVMEPRRIAMGDKEYDGISGEMVRRHVLENFVRLCQQRSLPLFEESKGLVPSRGKQGLIRWVGETVYTFDNMAELAEAIQKVREHLDGKETS